MRLLKKLLPYALAAGIILNPISSNSECNPQDDKVPNKRIKIVQPNLDEIVDDDLENKDVPITDWKVPILMYHDIGNPGEYSSRYVVSPNMLWDHLKYLNENDFVSINLSEYVNGQYKDLSTDKKPVVLTFDDATEGQFRFKENEFGHKYIDPDCAIAIMTEFYNKNPDFGLKATFFIDYVDKKGFFEVPFKQKGLEISKIQHIIKSGMEIGNHTLEHTNLKQSKNIEIFNQIKFLKYCMSLIKPDYNMELFAYPYGAIPNINTEKEIVHNEYEYVFAAWGGVAPDINSPKFDKHKIPRIEINNDFINLKTYVK